MRLSSEKVLSLLESNNECEWLDFKETYYAKEKKADLIHDLLCMTNADAEGDRYILIGIANAGEIIGLKSNLSDNNFWSDIRSAKTNLALPVQYYEISIEQEFSKINVGVIHITNDKRQPYVLTEDFTKNGKTIRAGVVYTRDSSNNTPINGTAHHAEIEKMWRRRFGLDNSPSQRVLELIRDPNKWLNTERIEGTDFSIRFHNDFPEYTLETTFSDRHANSKFYEPWMTRIGDEFQYAEAQNTNVWRYYLKYHSTTLKFGDLMYVRGTMMPFPQTARPNEYSKKSIDMDFILKSETVDYFVSAICVSDRWQYDPNATDQFAKLDSAITSDVGVMFGWNAFEIERKRRE